MGGGGGFAAGQFHEPDHGRQGLDDHPAGMQFALRYPPGIVATIAMIPAIRSGNHHAPSDPQSKTPATRLRAGVF
ncbi:hypothetical protein H4P12_01605 [Paracoccus sp. 11-3]|uniref:Uncharacterized protein n=1 Tax=Paracoccus amoyensis TaxID=2760093 RepID=A0A926GDL6_9RHOB|nr:hypothetical protein [Paracoccus amoyensis]MBC9245434.1 hypothetical protein [Paracoccus amoyensis]